MAVSALNCPRCGLTVPRSRSQSAVEYCPRCLARSGGLDSIALGADPPSAHGEHHGIIARVAHPLGGHLIHSRAANLH